MQLKRLIDKCDKDRSLIVAPKVGLGGNHHARKVFEDECRNAGAEELIKPYPPVGLVLDTSPLEYRRAVELLGMFFKHEFKYDQRAYYADYPNPKDRMYIWTSSRNVDRDERETAIVGVCGFTWEEDEKELVLGWVYLHPCYRSERDVRMKNWSGNKGRLEAAWPLFRKLHGDFRIPPPHSAAFSGFLRKVGETIDEYGKLQGFVVSE